MVILKVVGLLINYFRLFQLGVTANKIMRMTLNSGDHIKTWRFSTMKVLHLYYFYILRSLDSLMLGD